jgi:hypothetical protein
LAALQLEIAPEVRLPPLFLLAMLFFNERVRGDRPMFFELFEGPGEVVSSLLQIP